MKTGLYAATYFSTLILLLLDANILNSQTNWALRFSEANRGWLEVRDDSTLVLHSFTVEFWTRIRSGGVLVSRDAHVDTTSDWHLCCDLQRMRLMLIMRHGKSDQYFYSPDGILRADTWQHVALVVNGPDGYALLYIDDRAPIEWKFSSRHYEARTGFAIGGYYNNNKGAYFSGDMSEIRYWVGERSRDDINLHRDRKVPLDARGGLRGYWMLCDGFADSSGYGHPLGRQGTVDLIHVFDLPAGLGCRDLITPQIAPEGTVYICMGSSVTLDAGAAYVFYEWSTGEKTRTISVSNPGSYRVYVQDDAGRFGTSLPVTVKNYSDTPSPKITKSQDTLYSTPGFGYQWYFNNMLLPGETARFIVMDRLGWYKIVVTDSFGCRKEAVHINYPLPDPVIRPAGSVEICNGSSIFLVTDQMYEKYAWSNGARTREIRVDRAGSYTVTVTDRYGRTATADSVQVTLLPVPSPPTLYESGDTIWCVTTERCQWFHDGLLLAGDTNRFILPRKTGTYRVEITNRHGCRAAVEYHLMAHTEVSLSCPTEAYTPPGMINRVSILLDSSVWLTHTAQRTFRYVVEYDPRLIHLDNPGDVVTIPGGTSVLYTGSGARGEEQYLGVLHELEFFSLSADSISTGLRLRAFMWDDAHAAVTLRGSECGIILRRGEPGNDTERKAENVEFGFHNYPNPFRDWTVFAFTLAKAGPVSLRLYDMNGRLRETVCEDIRNAGSYRVPYRRSSLPSGTYQALFHAGGKAVSQRVTIIR